MAENGVGSIHLFELIAQEILDNEDVILSKAENGVKDIEKILWAFMMRDAGTSEFFSEVVTWVKRYNMENMVNPLQMARFCGYLAKTTNVIGGGFGLYKTAERRIARSLRKMSFGELSNIVYLTVPLRIWSHEFNQTLQDEIDGKIKAVENFEEKIRRKKIELDGYDLEAMDIEIKVSDLVKLFKTYALNFNKDSSLIDRLMSKMIKYIEGMSNKQVADVLWGFVKGRLKNPELYKALEIEFYQRLNTLNFRTVAFSFAHFCDYGQISGFLYEKYLDVIEKKLTNDVNIHYPLKILQGIQLTGYLLNIQNYLSSDEKVKSQIKSIVNKIFEIYEEMLNEKLDLRLLQILNFLQLLAHSSYDIKNDERTKDMVKKLELVLLQYAEVEQKLEGIEGHVLADQTEEQLYSTHFLKRYTFDHICSFYYCFVQLRTGNGYFLNFISQQIKSNFLKVSRKNFSKVYFALLQQNHIEIVQMFDPIIRELHKYGDFKYFFNHEDYIKLIWSITAYNFHMKYPVIPVDSTTVPNAFILKSVHYDRKEVEEVFESNFEIIKSLARFSQRSLVELKESLIDINPNTLSVESLQINLQTLQLFNFLSKYSISGEIDDYLSFLNDHFRQHYIAEQTVFRAGAGNIDKLRSLVERSKGTIEEKISRCNTTGRELEIDVLSNFMDSNFQVYHTAVIITDKETKEVVSKIAFVMLREENFSILESGPFMDSEVSGSEKILMTTNLDLVISSFVNNWNVGVLKEAFVEETEAEVLAPIIDSIIQNFDIEVDPLQPPDHPQTPPTQSGGGRRAKGRRVRPKKFKKN